MAVLFTRFLEGDEIRILDVHELTYGRARIGVTSGRNLHPLFPSYDEVW